MGVRKQEEYIVAYLHDTEPCTSHCRLGLKGFRVYKEGPPFYTHYSEGTYNLSWNPYHPIEGPINFINNRGNPPCRVRASSLKKGG